MFLKLCFNEHIFFSEQINLGFKIKKISFTKYDSSHN